MAELERSARYLMPIDLKSFISGPILKLFSCSSRLGLFCLWRASRFGSQGLRHCIFVCHILLLHF